jgi:plastocyanin
VNHHLLRRAELALAAVAAVVLLSLAGTAGGAVTGLARTANSCDITQSKSISGTTKTAINFVNKSSGDVKLYWLDYSGKQVYYATIPAGRNVVQQTFDTHAWVVLDSTGKCIGYVVAPRAEYDILGSGAAPTPPAGASPEAFTVTVDNANRAVNESINAYFPTALTVHPGDSVVFHFVGSGEPHTATLGTLTDDAVAAFSKLSPAAQTSPPADAKAADAKLPNVFPPGSGDAVPSAANPCFLASGDPSFTAACPGGAQPQFDGKQSFYNSGWPAGDSRFTVHLSSSISPGAYRFMCLVHREGMSGTITVVPAATPVPTPAAVSAKGDEELATAEAKLAPVAAALEQGKLTLPGTASLGPNAVVAGAAPAGGVFGEIDEFGPKTLHIPVGGTVTWWITGDHSITFNSTKANNDVRSVRGGKVHLNTNALAPVGGKGEPRKPPKGGTKRHAKLAVVTTQSWDGKGFHNSGVFTNSEPPNIEGYRLTFTRKGTYDYICTVHDKMKGTVVVG